MSKTIERTLLKKKIASALKNFKIVALIGPRQVGKSTLAKDLATQYKIKHFFDLEDPTDESLMENPKLLLNDLEGLIVIDEIQRKPNLFPYLRVKADQMKSSSRILILGSSSRDLIEKASESLAGRVTYIEIPGFTLSEVGDLNRLFNRGGFPLSYLGRTQDQSVQWRKSYLQSYIERDLRGLGLDLPPQTIRRMLEMLTSYNGQIFNASELGQSLGFSHTTARKYLDVLIGTFLVRELKPFFENTLKRQVKSPKIYFRDNGLLFSLQGLNSSSEINRSPKIGSFWESFALEQVIQHFKMDSHDIYFWAAHQNGELDLLWIKDRKRIGFEFKYSDSPMLTSSMKISISTLNLDKLNIVYPGTKRARLANNVECIPLNEFDPKKE